MKYTESQIRKMSWHEWNETMAKELNVAGFKMRGFNNETGHWEDNFTEFKTVEDDPSVFILACLSKPKEYEYLKMLGLLNNGRCPMCGGPIGSQIKRFTSGFNNDIHFHICQDCCNKGRRTSINPANSSGCIVALLLVPWYIFKSFLN